MSMSEIDKELVQYLRVVRTHLGDEMSADAMADALRDLAASPVAKASRGQVPVAVVELDAIVEALEVATNDILSATEEIETASADMNTSAAEQVSGAVTRIYEAMNFQDITGQRVTKVKKILGLVEQDLSGQFDGGGSVDGGDTQNGDNQNGGNQDDRLLNGPGLAGSTNSQDDIDALFASSE